MMPVYPTARSNHSKEKITKDDTMNDLHKRVEQILKERYAIFMISL